MTIQHWGQVELVGGLRNKTTDIGPVCYRPPNLKHVERLAHAGSMTTFHRQARATQRRQIVRERVAGLLLILAAIAALIIFGANR